MGKTSIGALIFLLVLPLFPKEEQFKPFICPLDNCLVKSTRLFSVSHRAVDIEAGIGDPVYASASGRVYQAGIDPFTGDAKRIIIIHSNGYVSIYWHLESFAVNRGDYVYQGSVIGYSGQTGWADWPHLHFGLIDPAGNYLNPLRFIDMELQ